MTPIAIAARPLVGQDGGHRRAPTLAEPHRWRFSGSNLVRLGRLWPKGGVHVRRLQIAAGVVTHDDCLLLVRQNSNDRTYWSLPGGVIEDGEDLLTGLSRELHEEAGIRPRGLPDLAHVTELRTPTSCSTAFVFRVPEWERETEVPYDPSGEVDRSGLFPFHEARALLAELPWPSMRQPVLDLLDGGTRMFWSYTTGADGDPTGAVRAVP